MTAGEIVRVRVLALASVTAIVGSRVYLGQFPQEGQVPSVRIQRIDELEGTHLRGAGGPYRARVQVDSVAVTLAAAFALDAAMHGDGAGSGLSGWAGTLGSPSVRVLSILPSDVREVFDAEEFRVWRVMRDYIVSYQ